MQVIDLKKTASNHTTNDYRWIPQRCSDRYIVIVYEYNQKPTNSLSKTENEELQCQFFSSL